MKLLFIALLGFLACHVQAQELTKIIRYKDKQQEEIEYYVLKKDNKTKKGKYQIVDTYSKYVLKEGYFKNNLKDSLWIEYLRGTPHKMKEGYYVNDKKTGIWRECMFADNAIFLSEKGAYKDDVRVGPWQFFNKEGETIKVFDYSHDTLLYAQAPADSIEFDVLIDNIWQKRKLERAPDIIPDNYGNKYFSVFFDKVRYPIEAQRAGIEGKVVIGFSVNEQGIADNFYVKKKLHPKIDEEALRVSKFLNLKCYPGLLNGKPVTTRMEYPMLFTIR